MRLPVRLLQVHARIGFRARFSKKSGKCRKKLRNRGIQDFGLAGLVKSNDFSQGVAKLGPCLGVFAMDLLGRLIPTQCNVADRQTGLKSESQKLYSLNRIGAASAARSACFCAAVRMRVLAQARSKT